MEEERTITLDLGSSPDPLIDPVLSPPMMPPSTIKKLTPAAERLITARTAAAATAQSVRTSYNPSSVSRTPLAPTPRRQTFELDVGDEDAPQRLLVTVEAESDPRSAPRSTAE
jgi:serine/arginine repetitive matrix protein 2